ncbi:fumarylacetoacetate hydrolase family protein [Arthrobacter sp. H14-L1]|uniref:fumarylacetoacetate hydrolase family protein n=1 Tax=Arthrobacter sp. H14-L1 TaxID=2996697 RepID=UPI00226EE8CC|nr:fumarylacetoacetate hydrolase family protein [Arthrobacter sp. H14-L1]MCY0905859.1 fumarylacetoacetate hydrolase family protein [Arthrobacter sp. H14-L1]
MKFARVGPHGAEIPVLVHEQRLFSLQSLTADIDGAFLATGGPAKAAAALAAGELTEVPADGVRYGAPIARPSAVIGIGQNYAAHAAESGSLPPEQPIIFLKTPNTVSGPNDPVTIPHRSTKTDWEVELGVVIGKTASYLDSKEAAREYIAGYVTVNDLSERDFQINISGGQWSKGKNFPGFCPTGPYLVTPDEVDAGNLRLSSWVNGEPRQNSTTSGMVFDVETLIHDLSQYLVLEPGDLICTGTPEGVALSGRFPYLKAGDVLEIEVEGLGRQRQDFLS